MRSSWCCLQNEFCRCSYVCSSSSALSSVCFSMSGCSIANVSRVHGHLRWRTWWQQITRLDTVSIWLCKPISVVFAQRSFSFWGQNHIKESCGVTAGHCARSRKCRIYTSSWPPLEESCQAKVQGEEAILETLPACQQACWVAYVIRRSDAENH